MVKSYRLTFGLYLTTVEVITVAGLPGIKTSILPTNTEFSILFLYNNRVYTLAPVHGPSANAVDPKALALFYEVLETFEVKPSRSGCALRQRVVEKVINRQDLRMAKSYLRPPGR